jgi:hypothetical protein
MPKTATILAWATTAAKGEMNDREMNDREMNDKEMGSPNVLLREGSWVTLKSYIVTSMLSVVISHGEFYDQYVRLFSITNCVRCV